MVEIWGGMVCLGLLEVGMGWAFETLTPSERYDVALAILTNPEPRELKIGAHCPFHTESTPGGAFFYDYSQDVGHCHSCGQSNDLVGIFNAVNGRNVHDKDGFKEFAKRFAPNETMSGKSRDERRHVGGGGLRQPEARVWAPGNGGDVPAAWSERAESFVDHAVERLQEMSDQIERLAAWGITADEARVLRIGYNDKDKFPGMKPWGLEPQTKSNGQLTKMFLPRGLVLPFYADGRCIRLKIRRENEDLENGPADMAHIRYYQVKGGSTRYYVYGKPKSTGQAVRAWVVVETERDAAMVWAQCRRRGLPIGAMGMGSISARPDQFAHTALGAAEIILCALDFDGTRTDASGQTVPSPAAIQWRKFWEPTYPQAKRWPSPPALGKDVGEAVGNGLDVARWVWAGLPGHVRRALQNDMRPVSVWKKKDDSVSIPPLPELHGLSDTELKEMIPADAPGRDAYFEARRMLATSPVRLVRRLGGLGVEYPDERWATSNAAWFRTLTNLIFGDAYALLMEWDAQMMKIEKEEQRA